MSKIILATFSHVDLSFVKFIEEDFGDNFILYRFKHTDEWIFRRKGFITNILQIFQLALKIYRNHKDDTIVIFGNQLCRLFFFLFKYDKCFYIFNEMPSTDNFLLKKLDQLIFIKVQNIFISSYARMNLLALNKYYIGSCQVLENITFPTIHVFEKNKKINTKLKAIFIGTIDSSRFGTNTLKYLTSLIDNNIDVDILPSRNGNYQELELLGIVVLQSIDHSQIHKFLLNYDIGILSYEPTSLNNFYAAPLKLYEYLNANLKILSLHDNAGIEYYKVRYPSIFFSMYDKNIIFADDYYNSKYEILNNAINSNKYFYEKVQKAAYKF